MKKSLTKLQARFSLFKRVGNDNRLVCPDLSSSQASLLLPDLSGAYRLKFTGMMKVNGNHLQEGKA